MGMILTYDATGLNLDRVPASAPQVALYTTGSGGVQATAAQLAAHPGAVRICQDAGATDPTADVLDIESGAATYADAGPWYHRAIGSRGANARPGQRLPMFYASASNITPLVNALIAEGVHAGPRLWVAHWGIGQAAATADVTNTGPFPIEAYQFANDGTFDLSVFDSAWLASGQPATRPPVPQWGIDAIADLTTIATDALAVRTALQANL
jgi:hypothetical protein